MVIPVGYVALWKDMLRGQQEIGLSETNNVVRFTASAKYRKSIRLMTAMTV
jgi:hypothetical protein